MRRTLTLVLAAVCALIVHVTLKGQSSVIRVFIADTAIDGLLAKQSTEAVKQLDQQATLSWDGPYLKVKLNAGIGAAEVLRALNQNQARFAQLQEGVRSGMPVRVDTGDPAADDRRYQQAKAAWLEGQQSSEQPAPTTNE